MRTTAVRYTNGQPIGRRDSVHPTGNVDPRGRPEVVLQHRGRWTQWQVTTFLEDDGRLAPTSPKNVKPLSYG